MLIDTHTHLYWESFKEDFDQVIQSSLEAGITTIINVGVDVQKSAEALAQVEGQLSQIPELIAYSTIGIHPHEAWKYAKGNGQLTMDNLQKDINKLEEIYHSNPKKVVAVGECGLDFFFDNNPDFIPSSLSIDEQKNLQRKLFISQIDLAKKLNLPLIVHVRDDRSKNSTNSECWDEAVKIAKDHYGIFHCYSGLPNTTYNILNTNFLISFAGTLTYPKNEYLREAAKIIPLERIVLETDCPFLPPQSIRGQRNEPSSVKEIAELVAEIKDISYDEVAEKTTENVKKLFHLQLALKDAI